MNGTPKYFSFDENPFFFHDAPSVNTQISKAVMATAFEHFKSIATTNEPAPKMMSHAFLDFIETNGMHSKLAIRYSTFQQPNTSIKYFFH